LRISGGAPPDLPFALVETVRGGIRLAAVDARAQALGIVPGLTLADARARATFSSLHARGRAFPSKYTRASQ